MSAIQTPELQEALDAANLLFGDLYFCKDKVLERNGKPDGDFWNRTFVKVLLTTIEGFATISKRLVLVNHKYGGFSVSPAELAMLNDQSYALNDSGEAIEKRYEPDLLRNLRFVFDILPRSFGFEHKVDLSGKGWAALQTTIKIRNRLTHPITPTSFDFSEGEGDQIIEAYVWFHDVFESIYTRIAEILKK